MTIQLWKLSYNNSLEYSFAVCLELVTTVAVGGNPSAGYLGNTLWHHAIQTVPGRAPTNPQVASPFTEFSMSTGWSRQVYTSINEQFININIQHIVFLYFLLWIGFLNPVILVYICSSLPDLWPAMYTRYVSLSIQNPNLEFLSNSFLCRVYICQIHRLQPQHNFYFPLYCYPLYCYMWHLSFSSWLMGIRMFNVHSETHPEGLVLISCSHKLLKQRAFPAPSCLAWCSLYISTDIQWNDYCWSSMSWKWMAVDKTN